MARNVEIKAKLPTGHAEQVAARAMAQATAAPQVLHQDDTFYACAQGRLKLRRFSDGTAELIAYQRPDLAGPKTSSYRRTTVADAEGLHTALQTACGVVGRVRKRRHVVLVGRTRVHLDNVEGLGCFLELEVALRDGEPECDGIDEAEALMLRLGVEPAWLVEGAYLDLLAAGPSDHQG